MDEFADVMEQVEQPINTKLVSNYQDLDLALTSSRLRIVNSLTRLCAQGITVPVKRHIRVALIDDGVKTSYAGLDDNVFKGESGWQQPEPDATQTSPAATRRSVLHSYNSSQTGHGTVMAYYIRRVCPKVHLYVAKLEPEPHRGEVGPRGEKVTFSRDSAAKVSAAEHVSDDSADIRGLTR